MQCAPAELWRHPSHTVPSPSPRTPRPGCAPPGRAHQCPGPLSAVSSGCSRGVGSELPFKAPRSIACVDGTAHPSPASRPPLSSAAAQGCQGLRACFHLPADTRSATAGPGAILLVSELEYLQISSPPSPAHLRQGAAPPPPRPCALVSSMEPGTCQYPQLGTELAAKAPSTASSSCFSQLACLQEMQARAAGHPPGLTQLFSGCVWPGEGRARPAHPRGVQVLAQQVQAGQVLAAGPPRTAPGSKQRSVCTPPACGAGAPEATQDQCWALH